MNLDVVANVITIPIWPGVKVTDGLAAADKGAIGKCAVIASTAAKTYR